jgi:hypothetical protein
MPGVAAACRSLGVDYAPALVGFDVQGGRNLPKILGVVVCEVRWLVGWLQLLFGRLQSFRTTPGGAHIMLHVQHITGVWV